jgi:Tfp pilus assembly protein PilZ
LRTDVEVTDISLGGACLHLGVALRVGDAVTLGLVFPTRWDPLMLSGRVAWVAEEGEATHAGIAFEAADARTTLDLYRLVGDQVRGD